jgi:hypothetical protein
MKEKIIAFFKSTKARAFYWQTANGFVLLLIGLATTIQPDVINPAWALILAAALAGLNMLTKHINQNYL